MKKSEEDTGVEDFPKRTIQQKIHRLHSHLFGIDAASDRGDAETALGLGLRLLGFLESESQTAEDVIYIEPIKKQVLEKVATASLETGINRLALEEAKVPAGFKFRQDKPIDLEKVKNSKFYRAFVQRSKPESSTAQCSTKDIPDSHVSEVVDLTRDGPYQGASFEKKEEGDARPNKALMQSRLTSLYQGQQKVVEAAPFVEDVRLPEPAPKANSTAATFPTAGPYRRLAAEIKGNDRLPSPEPEERINPYSLNRKRPNNPYGAKRKPEKFKKTFREGNRDDISTDDDSPDEPPPLSFVTAKEKLAIDQAKKNGGTPTLNSYSNGPSTSSAPRPPGKTLGMSRRGVRGSFIPPVRGANGASAGAAGGAVSMPRGPSGNSTAAEESTRKCMEMLAGPDGELPDRLKNLEPRLLEHVSNEIMDQDPNVRWDDIAGLEHAKKCVTEMVIWPLLRPDIFQGCRAPGKGLLLFGPPGTGKTMIGKAIAGEAKATFFSISASSLTSKWIGEGEKLVRALFGVASCRQPAVIFIDEIDSLLSQRKSEGEHESSRRLKTQFLIEMEGCGSGTEQILLIGATNRPQELDEAARRRLSKRLYIPLPSHEARAWIIRSLLIRDGLLSLSDEDVDSICTTTDGYSGSDMKNLVKEASMGPLRELLMQGKDISSISQSDMRPITLQDFTSALQQVRPSVSPNELGMYEDWNRQFGSLAL
ncbi:hypothetical protein KC19_1G132600 [Ceratodon purpureus]|uniref:AAA+ ATPase domain-containing protein n=1 Tax=Ceratodon purpureus TaxID=3225 RepID=A0A8T0J6P8_CERPU|nr:hypothetical protein KC19_1G132600 [Ceratodon purpureus]